MRVLVWQELFWPCIGGIEVLAVKLFSALRQRGYDLIVVTRQDSPNLPSEANYLGIPIHRYPFPSAAFTEGKIEQLVEIRRRVARLVQSFRPDLVHLNAFGPSFFLYQNIGAHATPLIATLHTTPRSIISTQTLTPDGLFQKTLRRADWVACVSNAVLVQARELAPEIHDRSSVIYNGLEPPAVSPQPLCFTQPRLLCLGRLIPEKGFDLAISAFAAVMERFPGARLTIAGDGPARASLEQHAGKTGVASSVEFLGWVPPEKVVNVLNSATAVLMPSHREGLPSVALEAALAGRPIVATRVGGLPEVVVHEETGLLVEDGDAQALARATIRLLGDPSAAASFGAAGRRRAATLFSFDRYVGAYAELYQKMTSSPGVTQSMP
jgi:glycosyltransferase involved in cell wall biosynthesis